jgi:hypothetical protein
VHYRHAVEIAARAGQEMHPWSAFAWLGVTNASIGNRDREEAVHSFREAKRILRAATEGNEALVCSQTQRYASRIADLGAHQEAVSTLSACYDTWNREPGQATAAWRTAGSLAQLYDGLGDTDSASAWRARQAAIDTLR